MGCASCSQKYRAGTSKFRRVPTPTKQRIGTPMTPTKPKTIVQPQPEAAVAVPVPDIAIEPATGHEVSVIKTGESTDTTIGETEVPGVVVIDNQGMGSEGADV